MSKLSSALSLPTDKHRAAAGNFHANTVGAIDPNMLHRAPETIWALGRHKPADREPGEFIPVPKQHRKKRQPPAVKMMRNPNWESGFNPSNTR